MLRNSKKKGFTLVELVIVIAIIGILIAIAVPKFADATRGARNRRIESNARTLSGAVTQFYAANEKWPDKAADLKKMLESAGLPEASPTGAKYTFEVANSVITIKYTWTDDGDAYSGTLGKVTAKVADFKF